MALGSEDYIRLTTFTPVEVSSVERVVEATDMRVGFWTPDGIELQARIGDGLIVTVQACSSSGKVKRDEPVFEAKAEILTEGPLFEEIKAKTQDKYGFGLTMEEAKDTVKGWFGKGAPDAVVILNVVG